MNIYFIDPTYLKDVAWKPLLDVLKVKSAFSFIKKQDLPQTLLDIINPYTKHFYNGEDTNKYTNSCVFWLRAKIERNVSLFTNDYARWKDIPASEKKKYSQSSAYNNLKNLNDDNILVLLKLNTSFDLRNTKGLVGGFEAFNISSYCLNILRKKHHSNIYDIQTAFIAFDSFFDNAYLFRHRLNGFYIYNVQSANQQNYRFISFIKRWINQKDSANFPLIEKDGKKFYSSLITDKGKKERQHLIEEAKKEEEELKEQEKIDAELQGRAEDEREMNERDYNIIRDELIWGGVWDYDD